MIHSTDTIQNPKQQKGGQSQLDDEPDAAFDDPLILSKINDLGKPCKFLNV